MVPPHSQNDAQLSVQGRLSDGDLKTLQRRTRSSTIGPTTTYYAGVTAPVIGASMALIVATTLGSVGFDDYWSTLLSALCAAMAGIVWYLIFMRWSYRHRAGRGAETELETHIDLNESCLSIVRGAIETRISWSALVRVQKGRNYTLLTFNGTDPLIIPDKWFRKNKAEKNRFREYVERRLPSCQRPDGQRSAAQSRASDSYALES